MCAQSSAGIYKGNFAQGSSIHNLISLNIFGPTPFSAFGRMYTFTKDPSHSFINKTPDPLVSVFVLYVSVKLSSIIC